MSPFLREVELDLEGCAGDQFIKVGAVGNFFLKDPVVWGNHIEKVACLHIGGALEHEGFSNVHFPRDLLIDADHMVFRFRELMIVSLKLNGDGLRVFRVD